MADDLDYLKNLGISKGEIVKPESAYEKMLMNLAQELTNQLRDATMKKAQNTGALAASVGFLPDGKLSVTLQADEYFKFMDEGVNPTSGKKFDSPYSFKHKYVTSNHATAIQSWKGYDESRAYASASATKNKYGLKPREILKSVINDDTLKKMANDLSLLMGLTLEVVFDKNTKTWR